MSKQIYISADYSDNDGDRVVVEKLNQWGQDNLHKVDFKDMAKVASGTVAKDPDCRACDLKAEFNSQINVSSAVIFIVGDKTSTRTAGSGCNRATKTQLECYCTPYKNNTNGRQLCKVCRTFTLGPNDNVGCINSYSYLKHEFAQAKKKGKQIIVLYNSTRRESSWLPSYLKDYEDVAMPFWYIDAFGKKVGNYPYIKKVLGFD